MQANYVQRMRLTFSKEGPARYIGHLDLARTLERALNRARIPVSYTQGFNRRPRMQFAAALPLGFTSTGELADIWLATEIAPQTLQEQLMEKMAPGIDVWQVEEVALKAPALQNCTSAAQYAVLVGDLLSSSVLQERVNQLLQQEELWRERRGKRYDLRPLVLTLTLPAAEAGAQELLMWLDLRPGKSGRPDEVLAALGMDPLDLHIRRTAITLDEN